MRIYISGAITGRPTNEYKREFKETEEMLWKFQQETINPAKLDYLVPDSFTHDEYMHICIPLLETCDGIYMLRSWTQSKGAREELEKAIDLDLEIMGHASVAAGEPISIVAPDLRILNPPKKPSETETLKIGDYATIKIDDSRLSLNTRVRILGITNPDTDPNNILVQNAEGQTTCWYREDELAKCEEVYKK